LEAEALHRVDHLFIEVRCAVEDKVTGSRVVRKGFPQLLDNPCAGRVFGDAATQDARRSCAITKKQYSTPKVSVGTVKKSIAAMASR
jgi:hypothetical protein